MTRFQSRPLTPSVLLLLLAQAACTGDIGAPGPGNTEASPWVYPVSEDVRAASPEAAPSGDPKMGQTPGCEGSARISAKRVVRLSFNQLANSIGSLVSRDLVAKLVTDNDIVDWEHRAFPPLQSPREGNSVTDATWKTLDTMAASAARFVVDNFTTLSKCGTSPTDDCAKQYLLGLALIERFDAQRALRSAIGSRSCTHPPCAATLARA